MKNLVLSFLFIFSSFLGFSATITSTTTGGNYSANMSWVGGTVPGTNDDVVINGPITLNGNFSCKNLTINSGASIVNHSATTYFYIQGNVANNGSINKDINGWALHLTIDGNIYNNGTWQPNATYFNGASNQTISQNAGKTFEGSFTNNDTLGNIVLTSHVSFSNNAFNFNNDKVIAGSYNLSVSNGTLYNIQLFSNSSFISNKSHLSSSTFSGNYQLKGYTTIYSGVYFYGTATIADTIVNDGATRFLYVIGKIINNGAILNNSSGWAFYIYTESDITNNGVWQPYYTFLNGNSNQTLSQASGKWFEGQFQISDTAGKILLGSDVYFRNNAFYFNYGKITTNGFDFNTQGQTLYDGTFSGNDTLKLKQSFLHRNMVFEGNYTIQGPTTFGANNILKGNATLIDTFKNDGATRYLYINGNVTNNGAIIRDNGGWSMLVYLKGNIHNNGYWNPRNTYFDAKTDQTITQTAGKWFDGQYEISDTSGKLLLGSDVYFRNDNLFFNYGKLLTNGYDLNTLGETFYNTVIESNDTLKLKKSYLYRSNTLQGNFVLQGPTTIGDNTVIKGNVTLLDTFTNDPATRYLTIYGNLVNNGAVIRDKVGGWAMFVYLKGNIYNNGYWNPYATYFDAGSNQTIYQSPGKWFDGQYQISDTSAKLILGSDVYFRNDAFYFNYGKVTTNGFDFNTLSETLYDGTLSGNDTLKLKNSYLNRNMIFEGNYTLQGPTTFGHNTTFKGNATLIDTFANDAATRYLYVLGNITNNGAITRDKYGWPLIVNLKGNAHNNGLWNPNETHFDAKNDQTITQTSGKWFDGRYYITDTSGRLLMGSDLYFRNEHIYFNKGKLTTNGFNLNTYSELLWDGFIAGNDTLKLKYSYLTRMTFDGNYALKGRLTLGENNTFKGNVTLIDTFVNDGATRYLFFNGNVINDGIFLPAPNGWPLYIYSEGNIFNNGQFNNSSIYLVGKKDRTVGGKLPMNILCPVYVDDSVGFVGENFIPNLTLNNRSSVWTTVKAGAILKTLSLANPHRLINYGKVETSFGFDVHPSAFSFYHTAIRSNNTSAISKINIEHFGYQQNPNTTNAVNEWWRFKSIPSFSRDSLNYVELNYSTNSLNGNSEKDLKIFFTENGGIDWKEIKRNITRDTLNNKIKITNAPSNGHFVLSSSGLGLVVFKPKVEKAEPRFFGNTGKVTIYGFGAGFKAGMTVSISKGSNTYTGEEIKITDQSGESFSAAFTLISIDTGYYDLSVTIPGESPIILSKYFHVEKSTRPEPWALLSGRNRFLLNRWSTFYINYGNKANVNALGVPLVFAVNDVPNLEVDFPDNHFYLPKVAYDSGFTLPIDSNFKLYYITDSLTGFIGTKMRVYAFYIPEIEANSSQMVRVMVKLKQPAKLTMDLWVMDPFMENIPLQKATTPPEVAACITAAALKYSIDKIVGFVPGYACYKLIYKYVDPVGSITPKDIKPDKSTWGSWFWNTASWVSSGLKCAADFNPAWKTAQIVAAAGSAITGFVIDVGKNREANEGCWRKFRDKNKNKLDANGVYSFDPNEIAGPFGYGAENYIGKGNLLSYRVYFENKDSATAPATDVVVYDTIDLKKLNHNTFSFGEIVIADSVYPVQAFAKSFSMLIDLYPRIASVVRVAGNLDTSNGVISVTFNTLDRSTLDPNEDVDLGFLPPNKGNSVGEANFSYTIGLKNTIKHGDVITNQGFIYFDQNKPIATNIYSNEIDIIAPSSSVNFLNSETTDSNFVVSWSGSDNDCGLNYYNIFVSDNDSTYKNWLANTSLTTSKYHGHRNHTYKFYSIAIDSIGNTESYSGNPDATTKVVKTGDVSKIESFINVYPNPSKGKLVIESNLNSGPVFLKLYDPLGRLVAEKEATTNTIEWDLSLLKSQIYYLVIEANGQKMKRTVVLMNK
jgi:hypothetical protein